MEPLFGRCASVTQGAAKTMKIAGIIVLVNPARLRKASPPHRTAPGMQTSCAPAPAVAREAVMGAG